MKKTFEALGISLAMLLCLNLFAYAADFSLNYSEVNDSVSVKSSRPSDYITIVVKPYGSDVVLSTESINTRNDILYKVADNTDNLLHEILLSDKIPSGKYSVIISDGKNSEEYVLLRPEQDKLLLAVESLNNSEGRSYFYNNLSEYAEELGCNASTECIGRIAEGMYNNIQSHGYNAQSLMKVLTAYEGMALCEKKDITFARFMKEYSPYIEQSSIYKYSKLTNFQKEKVEEVFGYSEYVEVGIDKAVDNTILLAKVKGASDYESLRDDCVDYFTANNVSMTEYNSITNEYRRDSVWYGILSDKSKITNVGSLINLFKQHTKQQADKNSSNNDGGGAGGGGIGGNGGGSVVSFGAAATPSGGKGASYEIFSDIEGHWAKNTIEEMYKMNIINGFEDRTFRPERSVTRAELVKMLTGILEMETEAVYSFDDVSESDWYFGYVGAAYNKGLVTGITEKSFAPENNITRQDAAVIVYRAIEKYLDKTEIEQVDFDDEDAVSDYAQKAVSELSRNKIIRGSDGKFYPEDGITRAETAVLLMRVKGVVTQEGE